MFGSCAAGLLSTRLRAASAQTTAPIRFGITMNDSGLGAVYAQEQGMFRQAGLNVDLQPFTNTSVAAQAIIAGAIDVGVMDCLQVANAVIHGFPLAAFAGNCAFSKESPTLVMVTAKSSAIASPRDLENQTVAVVALKSLSSSITNEWLRVNGADPANVKLFELPFPDMNAALQRGTVAAALQGEPFLSAGKADQRALGIPFEALGVPFYVNVYAASRAWLTNNGALAHHLAIALYDTARWVNAHRPATAVIESRFTKLPLETTRTMARNVFATSFDPQLIAPVLDLGARYGLISRAVRAQEVAFPV
jgi:ABC-type nitrate/sulfonate/bicarbonate transport system substrate-binding protein